MNAWTGIRQDATSGQNANGSVGGGWNEEEAVPRQMGVRGRLVAERCFKELCLRKDAILPVDANFEAHMVKIISAVFGISDW